MWKKCLRFVLAVGLMAIGMNGIVLAAEPAEHNQTQQQETNDSAKNGEMDRSEHDNHVHGWAHKSKKAEHFQLMMKVMEQKETLFDLTLVAAEKGNTKGIQAVRGYHTELKKLREVNMKLYQKLMAERKALHEAKEQGDKQAMKSHLQDMHKLALMIHDNLKATSELLDKAIAALQ